MMSREKFGKGIEKLTADEVYSLIGAYVNEKCENEAFLHENYIKMPQNIKSA